MSKEFKVINYERVRSYSARRVFTAQATPRSPENQAQDARPLPRACSSGRFGSSRFISQKELNSMRHASDVLNSVAKREAKYT